MTSSYPQDVYDRIIDLLGLPKGSEKTYWDIENSIPDTQIYLLHYITSNVGELIKTSDFTPKYDEVDCQTILKLRGLIIDLEEGWICCISNPYTHEVVLDDNKLVTNDDILLLEDKFGVIHKENVGKIKFQSSYRGPLVRVWKYKGVTYVSSHHRIFIDKSKWGTDRSFLEMFIDLFVASHNISTENKDNNTIVQEIGNILFSPDKLTSNTCHTFMIVSPDIVNDTRMNIGEGLLIYLNSFTLNHFYNEDAFLHYALHKDIEYKNTWASKEDFFIEKPFIVPDVAFTEKKKIVKLTDFSLTSANHLLSTGFSSYTEEELSSASQPKDLYPGESVIAILENGDILTIIPNSVDWRSHILGNNPDIYKRYCILLDKALDKDQGTPYEEMFHELGYPTPKELIEFSNSMATDGIIIPPNYPKEKVNRKMSKTEEREKEREDKRKNISENMVFAAPQSMIKEVGEFYTFYLEDVAALEKFMMKNYVTLGKAIDEDRLNQDKRFTVQDSKELNIAGKAIERILTNAAEYVAVRRKEGRDMKRNPKTKKEEKMTDKEMIEQNIKNLLQNERGSGLYALFRAING
jgi:hypothetical protein